MNNFFDSYKIKNLEVRIHHKMAFILCCNVFILSGIDLRKNGYGHQCIQLSFLQLDLGFSSGSDYKAKDLLLQKFQ